MKDGANFLKEVLINQHDENVSHTKNYKQNDTK